MYLQRLLQITMAALAVMGTTLLGMGQREAGLPLVMCLAAGGSVWVTDIRGWIRLSRNWANLAMLAVVVISLSALYPYPSPYQAANAARSLIYLQIILLFRRKDARIYWLLIMLSMLQVVVASLAGPDVFFGFLIVLYMLAATLGLTLMMLSPYWERQEKGEHAAPARAVKSADLRWPWIDQKSQLVGIPAGSSRQGLGWELMLYLGQIGLFTLGLTLVLFILVPRFRQFGLSEMSIQPQSMTGFSGEVTLGELGEIIENPKEVLRIRFFDHATDAPCPVRGEIYLRGTVLTTYENGKWRTGRPRTMIGIKELEPSTKPLPQGLVRQECTIESWRRQELFYVAPYVPLQSREDVANIEVDDESSRLRRARHLCGRRFSYRLGTTAVRNGQQLPLVPFDLCDNLDSARQLPSERDVKGLSQLAHLANDWIDESRLPAGDRYRRAKYLEGKFASSGLFQYSLEDQKRNPDLDPVVDFVTRHRAAHCQYFAAALTLMLRSQKIPARIVMGFKTDEWNEFGQCYEVRQLHAHSWVEAWMPRSQIPPDLLHGKDYWKDWTHGGWVQLDPTPFSAERTKTSVFTPFRKAYQWLDHAWSYYVVELNYERQQKKIYQPLARGVKKIYETVINPEMWRSLMATLADLLHLHSLPSAVIWTLEIFLGVLVLALLLGLAWLLSWIARIGYRRWLGHPTAKPRKARVEVEFYRRLEQLLWKFGLRRAAGQTPREFALVAGQRLATATGRHQLAPLPAVVAEAFYRVRFGRLPLDNPQSEAVEQALRQLAEIKKMESRGQRPR